MSSKLASFLLGSFALLATGCRSGDTSACTVREERACARPDERDAVELVFARRDYDSCREAVDDNSCGIDAEALRRCVDALPTPLCVAPEYWQVPSESLFQTTSCAEELRTFLECEDDDDSYSYSSYDDHEDDYGGNDD